MLSSEDFLADLIKVEIMAMKVQIEDLETKIEAFESMMKNRADVLHLFEYKTDLERKQASFFQKLNDIIAQKQLTEKDVLAQQGSIEKKNGEISRIEAHHQLAVDRVLATESQIAALKRHETLSQEIQHELGTLEQKLEQHQREAHETGTIREVIINRLKALSVQNFNSMERLKTLEEQENKFRQGLEKAKQDLVSFRSHIKTKGEKFSRTKGYELGQELADGELTKDLKTRMEDLTQQTNVIKLNYRKARRTLEDLNDQLSRTTPGDTSTIETVAALVCLRWADHRAVGPTDPTDIIRKHKIFSDNFRWSSWRNLQPEKLSELLMKELAPVVGRLVKYTLHPLSRELAQIGLPFQILVNRPPTVLAILAKWLDNQPLETVDDRRKLLGFFDNLLKSASATHSGVYRTPPQIASLVAALAAPSAADAIYDPCFGYAQILSAAFDHVQPDDRASLHFVGTEKSPENYVIGLARLILSGVTNPKLQFDNSGWQGRPCDLVGGGFNIVVSHMRRSFRENDQRPGMIGPQAGISSSQSISNALSKTCQGGRAVLVVPEITLFRGGPDSEFRERLIRENQIEAIISLPEGAIDPGSRLRDVILVVRRGGQTEKIRMVDAEGFFERTSRREPYTIKPGKLEELVRETQHPTPLDHGWDVSAESLAELSWDLSVRRRDQSALSTKLELLEGYCEIAQLGDCCAIINRPHVPDGEISNTPISENSFLYVDIGDLRGGIVTKSYRWLSTNSPISIEDSYRLRDGDVLLAKLGDVGRASVVRKQAIGAVASRTLCVIRADANRLKPIFLGAYLSSFEARSWLRDHTVGGTRGHLNERTLLTLPVPLPPLDLQHDLAMLHYQNGDDVLVGLRSKLNRDTGDPVVLWLEERLSDISSSAGSLDEPLNLEFFESLSKRFTTLRDQIVHSYSSVSENRPLTNWFLKFGDAVSLLNDSKNVPPGPSLLSILQNSAHGISESIGFLRTYLPIEIKANELSNLAMKRIQKAIDALFTDLKLVFSVKDNELRAGAKAEVNLTIIHKGFLPLRNIRVDTSPDWGGANFAFLGDGSTESMVLSGIAPETTGVFNIDVAWRAVTLDGEQIEGKTEIPFTVSVNYFVLGDQTINEEPSPYVTGGPVKPGNDDVFFGREDLLRDIRGQIEKRGNVILLEGNRRAGKTSILHHLRGLHRVKGWLGVFSDLQGAKGSDKATGVPTVEVFRHIAASIAKELRINEIDNPLPDGSFLPKGQKLGISQACSRGIGEDSSFNDFQDYLEQTLLTLKRHDLRLLLMLDEFDKLQQGIDNGITSPQTPENIRYLIQTYPNFSAILTGSRRLKRLREEYWSALFGLGTRFSVSSLSAAAAERLITEPVKNHLTYSSEAVKRAIYSTACQPFLLQCLCNRIFVLSTEIKSRSVTLDMVKDAEKKLVDNNEHFAFLWDYMGSHRRRFILALCHRNSISDTPYPFNFKFVVEQLSASGVYVDDGALGSDLVFLRELELLELDERPNSGEYSLGIPLMGSWIDQQQDLTLLERNARNETESQDGVIFQILWTETG